MSVAKFFEDVFYRDDDPPEIYVLEGDFSLQPLTPTQPMPAFDELDSKFAELVEELDLSAPNKAVMLSLPPQKKWQIYCSSKSLSGAMDPSEAPLPSISLPPSPEHYIERLKDMAVQLKASSQDESPSNENNLEIESHTALFDDLKAALRTSAHSFVIRFIELQGFPALLEILKALDIRVANSPLHTSLIGCIKALMNNSTGRTHVLAHPTGIDMIARSLAADNIKTKIATLEILGAVCAVPGGHKKVLTAMLNYQEYATERVRFQGIVNDLSKSTGVYWDDVNLKTGIMSFINAVLSYGSGQESLEFRLHLRYEFLMLGIQPVIDKLKKYENEILNRHLDFFEKVRDEDEKELARRFNHEHVDTMNANAMFDLLSRKLNHSSAYPHLVSLLQHMLLLASTGPNAQHWLIFDRIVQQIVLQQEGRPSNEIDPDNQDKTSQSAPKPQDPDIAPLQIDVRKIVKLLVEEEDLERENSEINGKLVKKVNDLQGCNGQVPPPPPPPPPPMMAVPPPPPAPGGLSKIANQPAPPKVDAPKKNIPQPANPLKSFNWSKLPDSKLQGTVWSDLDDTKWYNSIELESINKLFCAYQKNDVANDGLIAKNKTKILSVIDGRRAQNCTIVLSKLKMSDKEISKAILSMDSNEQLPIDMIEQLLKFTPSVEERALLDEHSQDIDSLDRADRFMYEISKIPHYEQRLRSLHYKKRFQATVNDLSSRITGVIEASREVARSRRMHKLLELVLALGNYMNRGARGNAYGFRLASLNRLADTKSSADKRSTLLHYLVQIIEKKFKDILLLEEDLPHVKDASKVSLGEMNKDITVLRAGLAEVNREIEFHRSSGVPQLGDRFLAVMSEFHAKASVRFTELEDQFQNMKTRFDQAVRLFGEDGAVMQPDEFFGIFDEFLSALMEAKQDNDNFRRRQEEEEKRARQEAELKQRTIERKAKEILLNSLAKNLQGLKSADNGDSPLAGDHPNYKGEFDDLIAALRTGDVFGDNMTIVKRLRKTRQRVAASNSIGRERSVVTNRQH
ncbi:disheveled-associated activator of morphogenesis 1-like [Aedes albopictus]|uniref:Disheveled-associated activator of morphogenesis 1 n=1 Tax=Aedes albopictus TaxID=7160 RepID=A0ABM1Y3X1_AEDAL